MNPTQELILGAFLPPVIDLINRYIKKSQYRYLVSLLVCLVAGALLNIKNLDIANILGGGALVFASAQTVYKTYWEKSNPRVKLEAFLPETGVTKE